MDSAYEEGVESEAGEVDRTYESYNPTLDLIMHC